MLMLLTGYTHAAVVWLLLLLLWCCRCRTLTSRWPTIQPMLLTEYAHIMAPGGWLYTITDVPELGEWMVRGSCMTASGCSKGCVWTVGSFQVVVMVLKAHMCGCVVGLSLRLSTGVGRECVSKRVKRLCHWLWLPMIHIPYTPCSAWLVRM
jgi:hypothetical protein